MTGSWKVDVNVGGMPEKVATAVSKLNEIVGVEYTPIAYLGSQVVNGTNHAVLCEQLVTTGRDTKNVVVAIFNEKPNDMVATPIGIERVVESGGEMGGIQVDVKTDIPEDAQKAFDDVFSNFVGSDVKPFAYLGSQVVEGVDYIFAVEISSVTAESEKYAKLLVVNAMTKKIMTVNLLTDKHDSMQLGYSFTWLKTQNTSLGKPLGEWP